MVVLRRLSSVFTGATSRAGLVKMHSRSPGELTAGAESRTKEGGLLEQIQLKVGANIHLQELFLRFSISTFS